MLGTTKISDPEFDFSYRVVRSSRRSMSIEITEEGEVIVRVPHLTPDWTIRNYIKKKENWIRKHLAKARERKATAGEPFTDQELAALKRAARADLIPRVEKYAKLMGVRPGPVSIRAQKTRWGSCSITGNISLNCLLVLLHEELRDYVVVHELAHMKEMNHSPEFWAEVEKILPNYKALRRGLKKAGAPLMQRLR